MAEKLPCGKFKYVDDISIFTKQCILNIDKNGDYFYVFFVDIHGPPELHDEHEELPVLCNQEKAPGYNVKKIVATFCDKNNYTISVDMLQFRSEKGLVLKKYMQLFMLNKKLL